MSSTPTLVASLDAEGIRESLGSKPSDIKEEYKRDLSAQVQKDVENGIRKAVVDALFDSFGHSPHLLAAFGINPQNFVSQALIKIAEEFRHEPVAD